MSQNLAKLWLQFIKIPTIIYILLYRTFKTHTKHDLNLLFVEVLHILFMFSAVLKRYHTIPPSEYESAGDDIVNVAVVIKDVRTEERVLAAQEFSLSSPQITIEVQRHPASLSLPLTEYYDSIM